MLYGTVLETGFACRRPSLVCFAEPALGTSMTLPATTPLASNQQPDHIMMPPAALYRSRYGTLMALHIGRIVPCICWWI